MPTRLRRPARWKFAVAALALIGFQAYLGYSTIRGQYGIESRQQMLAEIESLKAKSASIQAEIDTYRHRVDLFDPQKLDPDILTERARALLGMAQPDDLVIMIDPNSGLPVSGSGVGLAGDQLSFLLAGSSAH